MSENTIPTFVAWPTGQQDRVRARIAAHQAAGEIVQGIGWESGKEGAIGCSLDTYNGVEYARVLGIPLPVVGIVNSIHESLPPSAALDWPMRVAMALKPGTDTTHVWARFAIWLLRNSRREYSSDKGNEYVAGLYERRVAGDEPSTKEWEAALDIKYLNAEAYTAVYAALAMKSKESLSIRIMEEAEWAALSYKAIWKSTATSAKRQADALIAILDACV